MNHSHRRAILLSLLLGAGFSPAAARADEASGGAAATPAVLEFPTSRIRLETTRDAASGAWTLRARGTADAGAPALDEAPVLVLRDGSTFPATRQPDGSWRLRALRDEEFSGARIRVVTSGRAEEVAWTVPAAPSIAPAPPTGTPCRPSTAAGARPADAAPMTPPTSSAQARYGGRMIVAEGGVVEVVEDRQARALRLYVRDTVGRPAPVTNPPQLELRTATGERVIRFARDATTQGLWRASLDEMPGTLSGTLEVQLAGRTQRLALGPATSPSTPSPATASVLTFGDLSLRAICDPGQGTVRLEPLAASDLARIEGPPVLAFEGADANVRTLSMRPANGEGGTGWVAKDPALFAPGARPRVRVTVEGVSHEAPLPRSEARGEHGGRVVRIQDGPTLEVLHDSSGGVLTLYTVAPEAGAARVVVQEAPRIELTTSTGTRTLTLAPWSGQSGAWRVVSPDLRADGLQGRILVMADGRTHEASLGDALAHVPEPAAKTAPEPEAPADAPAGNEATPPAPSPHSEHAKPDSPTDR